MAHDTDFFQKFKDQIKFEICVSAPAKVVKVNGKKADIKPLFKDGNEEHALVLDAFILKGAQPVSAGDIVHVNFTDRALDHLTNQPFDPQYSRMHNISDAVIVGVYDL